MSYRGSGKTFEEASGVKPSPTLYFQKIPDSSVLGELNQVLQQQPGFKPEIRLGKGGAIAFADFIDTQHATTAMHNLRDVSFHGCRLNIREKMTLMVMHSYDKDDSDEKRKEKEEKKAKQEAHNMCERYNCKLCGGFVITLAKPLEKLPRRGTDQSYVADEQKHIVELSGDVVHIKREKGVEQQCRMNCEQCGSVVAYRPKPIGEESKFTYILDEALVSKRLPKSTNSVGKLEEGADSNACRSSDTQSAATALTPNTTEEPARGESKEGSAAASDANEDKPGRGDVERDLKRHKAA